MLIEPLQTEFEHTSIVVGSYPNTAGIANMVESGRIRLKQDNRRNRNDHHLYINYDNVFEYINRTLSKINNDLARLSEPTSIKTIPEVVKAYNKEWIPSIEFFSDALHVLLGATKNRIHTEAESSICFKRIAESLINLHNKKFKMRKRVEMLKKSKS